ncbi:Penicillin G acylase precursor [plant metagenome]|uniref:Penicillin G acylase n=1 Tax=plant metagenome TaxID=1297885 RepID=A0A484Q315_9ZZZZ
MQMLIHAGRGHRARVLLTGLVLSGLTIWQCHQMAVAATDAQTAATASQETEVRRGKATIRRDAYGVPSIQADDTYSLFYGYGYALAEDRLFQIESIRRTSTGRAAEIFGPDYFERDLGFLRNYDPETLRPQLAQVTGEHREALDGMVAGINARIDEVLADPGRLLPRQFTDLGFVPEQWTVFDVPASFVGLLLIGFADYNLQLSNQGLFEDLKAKHGDEEGERLFRALRWIDDPTAPTTVQPVDQEEGRAVRGRRSVADSDAAPPILPLSLPAADEHSRLLRAVWAGDGPDRVPRASNAWLVNGDKLADADAVMVGGPEVGDRVPSMIWSASLHGAGLQVTGSTYPGLPYFHFGTNGDIAWGRTALAGSVTDMYQERLHPEDDHRYWHNDQWVPMEKRTRTVKVKGQEDVTVELYSTVHGYVVQFDEENRTAYTKRRSWAGHEVETMLAYYDEMKAQNYEQWHAAISRKANNQSQYYADKEGNIAYLQAGRYPIRPEGYYPFLPSPGDGSMEWAGFQPFEYNAGVLNPRQGFIANWNNRPSPDVVNTDGMLWSRMNHVDTINVVLEAKPRLTVQEVWDVNRSASHASKQHRYFVPLIAAAVAEGRPNQRVTALANAITQWDGQELDVTHSGFYDSPGEAVYYEWVKVALEEIFTGLVPDKYLGGCESRVATYNCAVGQPMAPSLLYFALNDGANGTPKPEHDFLRGRSPADFIRRTLQETDRRLTERFGTDIQTWRNPVRQKKWRPENPMGAPWAGETERRDYGPDQKRGTMNALYVFRNGQVTMCDAVPPGQSGFIAPDGTPSPHYDDQFTLYTQFGCKPRHVTQDAIEANAVETRVLEF